VAADSSVVWQRDAVVAADIDCDGNADTAVVGRKPGLIQVGLIRGTPSTVEIIDFGVGAGSQRAVCSADAILTAESIDYDPDDDDVGALEGFQRSATCKGLNLGDDMCDSIHMYWNHAAGGLNWWRR
jgi:hypothetical protein